MSEHTPGPWIYTKGSDDGVRHISSRDPDAVSELFCDERYYPSCSDNDADWSLIAAAPDLYEAVKEYIAWGAMTGSDRDLFDEKFRAAIAKAEGHA